MSARMRTRTALDIVARSRNSRRIASGYPARMRPMRRSSVSSADRTGRLHQHARHPRASGRRRRDSAGDCAAWQQKHSATGSDQRTERHPYRCRSSVGLGPLGLHRGTDCSTTRILASSAARSWTAYCAMRAFIPSNANYVPDDSQRPTLPRRPSGPDARGTESAFLPHAHLRFPRRWAIPPTVNQFARLCAPGRPTAGLTPSWRAECDPAAPFLSIVIRTQGNGACAHPRGSADRAYRADRRPTFEVLVVGHRLASAASEGALERTIEDSPDWLRAKCRLLLCGVTATRIGHSTWASRAAEDTISAILDDDDLPFGHWVETFRRLDKDGTGPAAPRSERVRQDVSHDLAVARHAGAARNGPSLSGIYPQSFEPLAASTRATISPPRRFAFPAWRVP